MRIRSAVTVIFVAIVLAGAGPASAKDDLLEVLAQKGVITAAEYEKLKAQRKTEVTMTTDDGIKFTSSDNSTSIQFGTLQQFDLADYDENSAKLTNGTDLRRSRFSINGNFLTNWLYRVEYEFVGTSGITDGYIAYTKYKPLTVWAGQFKQPFGMESLAADKGVTFMERGLPFGFITTRAPGLMVSSSGTHWTAAGGLFGEPVGNANTAPAGDEGWGLVGRVTFAPFSLDNKVVHFGLGYLYREPTQGNSTNAAGNRFRTVRFRNKPESNVLAQRFVDTGEIVDVDSYILGGIEFALQWNALSWQSEYQWSDVDRRIGSSLTFDGWYSQLAYSLTGEPRPYRTDRGILDGVRPNKNLGADGWGAFEVAVRLSTMDLSDGNINGGEEEQRHVRAELVPESVSAGEFQHRRRPRGNRGPFPDEDPMIYQMRLQLAL